MRPLLMLILLFTLSHANAQAIDAPYIAYGDFLNDRLIIERADGGDSRVIADLFDESHNAVTSYGWSPSGRWFVVGSYRDGGEGAAYPVTYQAIRTDGGERVPLGTYPRASFDYRWSPTDEALIIAGPRMNRTDHVQVIDVESETQLAKFTIEDYWLEYGLGVRWSEDGEYGYFIDPQSGDVVQLYRDGRIEIGAAVIPETIEPAVTGEPTPMPPTLVPHNYTPFPEPFQYRWNHEQTWVLADYEIFFAGGGSGEIGSVVTNRDGSVTRDLPVGGGAEFVPDWAIPHLAPGQPTSFLREPIFVLPDEFEPYGVGWHPTDPNQLVVYSEESGFVFWSLESAEPEITNQVMPAVPYLSRFPDGLLLFWLPDQEIVAVYENYTLSYLDIATGENRVVEGVEYPNSDTAVVQQVIAELNIADLLTVELASDFNMFIEAYDLAYWLDVATGETVELPGAYDYQPKDSRGNIAVWGSYYDCCISILDTRTGALMDRFYATAYGLALSSDGRRLATTTTGKVSIWDMSPYLD